MQDADIVAVTSALPDVIDALGKEENLSEEIRAMLTKTGKHPTSLFYEIHTRKYGIPPIIDVAQEEDPTIVGRFGFVCQAWIGETSETWVRGRLCATKKETRLSCSIKALQVLCSTDSYYFSMPTMELSVHNSLSEFMKLHTFAKYHQLSLENANIMSCEKVLASIFLMEQRKSSTKMHLISLGSGNKCIRGDRLSLHGRAVNDCHAEIIARRGLLRFLYGQVERFNRERNESIFESNNGTGKLRLRKQYSFHFYISTAPCGDSRVYEFAEKNQKNINVDGRLRFKIEQGMGTVLGNEEHMCIQTFDGILGGERLRTMSCTDKILRWNALGVQGALLTKIIQPIYLSSITVAEKFDAERTSHALSGRIEGLHLASPFKVNKPALASCQGNCDNDTRGRDTTRSVELSANWNVMDNSLEVIQTSLGRVPSTKNNVSRISKEGLVGRFKEIMMEIKNPIPDGFSYQDCKSCCTDYETAKYMFEQWVLEKKKYGIRWQKKPEDTTLFIV